LILETLADHAKSTKDPEALTEYVRQALARAICREYMQPDGSLRVLTLDPTLENTIADLVRRGQREVIAAVEPQTLRMLYGSLLKQVENMTKEGQQPILLCSQTIRPYFRRLVERVIP